MPRRLPRWRDSAVGSKPQYTLRGWVALSLSNSGDVMSCTNPRSLSVSMTLLPDEERSGGAVSLAAARVSFDHRRENSHGAQRKPVLPLPLPRTTALNNRTLVFIRTRSSVIVPKLFQNSLSFFLNQPKGRKTIRLADDRGPVRRRGGGQGMHSVFCMLCTTTFCVRRPPRPHAPPSRQRSVHPSLAPLRRPDHHRAGHRGRPWLAIRRRG